MKTFLKKSHYSVFIIAGFLLLTYSSKSFAQNTTGKDETIPDSVISIVVNDFLVASNTGNRNAMQDFISLHYDPNVLKRIPLYMAVSLNMQFYYETGGMGYDLIRTLPSKNGLIQAEFLNKLTQTALRFEIPVSGAPAFKINYFIKTQPIDSGDNEKQAKQFSDDEMMGNIEKCLNNLKENDEFSGAVLLAKNGNVLLEKAIGMASKEYEVANKLDTKFNIASVGKMFTGLAITQLAEQGKLSFDDPLSKYVSSDWLNQEIANKIQIKHLLTHTSGLGDYFSDAYKQCAIPFFRELKDYQALTVDDELLFEPGTKFLYSNTGMLLLGVVIEKVTKTDYFTFLNTSIFEPAGMLNTDGFDKDVPVKNRATGYSKLYENGKVTWNNHQFTRIMRGSPSGGIYSTVEDLLKFDGAIRGNKLLSPEYTEILMEGRPEINASFHSYGFFVSESKVGRVVSHKGDGMGMNCQYKMFLDSGYTYIVLANYSAPSANIIANVIDQLIMHTAEKIQ